MQKRGVTINFSNKTFYTLVSILCLIVALGAVYAYNSGSSPSILGHSAEELEVEIDGTNYNLQEAIDGNLIGGETPDSNCVLLTEFIAVDRYTPKIIDVPNECKHPLTCTLVLKTTDLDGGMTGGYCGVSMHDFIQFEDGYWVTSYWDGRKFLNGDNDGTQDILVTGYDTRLRDDSSSWDTTKERLVLWGSPNYKELFYLCP